MIPTNSIIVPFQGETKTIDTNKMKTVRKRVRPLTLQGDFESRKLWQNVTKSLKDNDINKATEHKHFVSTPHPGQNNMAAILQTASTFKCMLMEVTV